MIRTASKILAIATGIAGIAANRPAMAAETAPTTGPKDLKVIVRSIKGEQCPKLEDIKTEIKDGKISMSAQPYRVTWDGKSQNIKAFCIVELGIDYSGSWQYAVPKIDLGVKGEMDKEANGQIGTFYAHQDTGMKAGKVNIVSDKVPLGNQTRIASDLQVEWSGCGQSKGILVGTYASFTKEHNPKTKAGSYLEVQGPIDITLRWQTCEPPKKKANS